MKRRRFYPVIHCNARDQIEYNIKLCIEAKTNGCFLINHGYLFSDVFQELCCDLIEKYQSPKFQFGVNYLENISNIGALVKAHKCDAYRIWLDNFGIDHECSAIQLKELNELSLYANIYEVEVYGGVHFKYQQKPTLSIQESIDLAIDNGIDSICLSGCATGKEANIEFIKIAFDHLKTKKTNVDLAICSGISIENIDNYLPYIDQFLVASSLLKDEDNFDLNKLKQMSNRIKEFNDSL
jgi:predicted TIM-barrel enzyme